MFIYVNCLFFPPSGLEFYGYIKLINFIRLKVSWELSLQFCFETKEMPQPVVIKRIQGTTIHGTALNLSVLTLESWTQEMPQYIVPSIRMHTMLNVSFFKVFFY